MYRFYLKVFLLIFVFQLGQVGAKPILTSQKVNREIKYKIGLAINRVIFKQWLRDDGMNLSTESSHFTGLISFLSPSPERSIDLKETKENKLEITIKFKMHPSNVQNLDLFAARIFYGAYKFGFDHYINTTELSPKWKSPPPWEEIASIYERVGLQDKIDNVFLEIYDERNPDTKLFSLMIPNWQDIDFNSMTEMFPSFFSEQIWISDYVNKLIEPVTLKTYFTLLNKGLLQSPATIDKQSREIENLIITPNQLKKIMESAGVSKYTVDLLNSFREKNNELVKLINKTTAERTILLRQLINQKEQIDILNTHVLTMQTSNKNNIEEILNLKKNISNLEDKNKKQAEIFYREKLAAIQETEEQIKRDFSKKILDLNAQIMNEKKKNSEKKAENKTLMGLIENNNKTIFELKTALSGLKQDLDDRDIQISSLNKELISVKDEARRTTETKLLEERENLKDMYLAKEKELNKAHEKEKELLKTEIDSLNNEMSKLMVDKKVLENNIKDEKAKNALLSNEIKSKKAHIQTVVENESELKKMFARLEGKLKYQEEKNKDAVIENQQYLTDLNELRENISSSKKEILDQKMTISKLENRIKVLKDNNIKYENDIKVLNERHTVESDSLVAKYEHKLSDLVKEKEDIAKKYDEKDNEYSNLINEIGSLKNMLVNEIDKSKISKILAEDLKSKMDKYPAELKDITNNYLTEVQKLKKENAYLRQKIQKKGELHSANLSAPQTQPVEQANKDLALRDSLINMYTKLGLDFYNNGSIDKAIEQFKKCVDMDTDNFESQYNLGAAYYYNNDYENAYAHLSTALKLNPENKDISKFLNLIKNRKSPENLTLQKESPVINKSEKSSPPKINTVENQIKSVSYDQANNTVKIKFIFPVNKINNYGTIKSNGIFLHYFDIENCLTAKDIVKTFNSDDRIKKIKVSQYALSPNKVTRIVLHTVSDESFSTKPSKDLLIIK